MKLCELKQLSGIYCIKNITNNKIYIGSAINIKNRFAQHLYQLNNNKHENPHLQNSWNKYKGENFIFEILEYTESNKNSLLAREQHYLDHHPLEMQYNIQRKAGSGLGLRHSEETKRIISMYSKRYHSSAKAIEDRKRKVMPKGKDHHNYGKKLSEYVRRRISESSMGKVRSAITKQRWWESMKLKYGGAVARKAVHRIDAGTGEILQTYNSIMEASKNTEIYESPISSCCHNRRRSAGNYIWCFHGEEDTIPNKVDKIKNHIHHHSKPVYQIAKETGEILNTFVNIAAASRELGIKDGHISAVCKGRYGFKSAGGFVWKYVNQDNV